MHSTSRARTKRSCRTSGRWCSAGVVEYYNFSAFAPPFVLDPLMAQSHCYFTLLHGADESEMTWATTIDVDEYMSSRRTIARPGYVRRQLERLPARVSALMLENFVMHGVPNASEELLDQPRAPAHDRADARTCTSTLCGRSARAPTTFTA
jgi:hypothetical protein